MQACGAGQTAAIERATLLYANVFSLEGIAVTLAGDIF